MNKDHGENPRRQEEQAGEAREEEGRR